MNIKVALYSSFLLFFVFCLPWQGGLAEESVAEQGSAGETTVAVGMPIDHSLVSDDPAPSPLFLLLLGSAMVGITLYRKKHLSRNDLL